MLISPLTKIHLRQLLSTQCLNELVRREQEPFHNMMTDLYTIKTKINTVYMLLPHSESKLICQNQSPFQTLEGGYCLPLLNDAAMAREMN